MVEVVGSTPAAPTISVKMKGSGGYRYLNCAVPVPGLADALRLRLF